MKLLSVCMVIVCLIIIPDPCCGTENQCSEQAETAGNSHEENSGPEESYPCSAFFTCGNCPGFIVADENTNPILPTSYKESPLNQRTKESECTGHAYGLFKPPRKRLPT